MTSNVPFTFRRFGGHRSALLLLLGALIFGCGLLIRSVSVFGGGWIAAIGLALSLSGVVTLEAVGDQLGLSPNRQHRISLAVAGPAVVLALAFVAVNGATFEASELESSS